MKTFYGGLFIKKEELAQSGINYPIKLEYYKTTQSEENEKYTNFKYGIEVVKTAYFGINHIKVDKKNVENITDEESKIETILEKLKRNEVTPIGVEYVIADYLNGLNLA